MLVNLSREEVLCLIGWIDRQTEYADKQCSLIAKCPTTRIAIDKLRLEAGRKARVKRK